MSRTARRPGGLLAAAGWALAAALLLSGCAAGQISQTADEVAAVDGGNATVGKMAVRNVQLATTASPGYAKGADAPLLVAISNDGLEAEKLVKVSSPAATSVTVKGTASLPAQTLTTVGLDTPLTLTLTGLTADVPFGHTIQVTFAFATSGSITLNVPIALPPERSGERPTVPLHPAEPTLLWESGLAQN